MNRSISIHCRVRSEKYLYHDAGENLRILLCFLRTGMPRPSWISSNSALHQSPYKLDFSAVIGIMPDQVSTGTWDELDMLGNHPWVVDFCITCTYRVFQMRFLQHKYTVQHMTQSLLQVFKLCWYWLQILFFFFMPCISRTDIFTIVD